MKSDGGKQAALKAEIDQISGELKRLRREVHLCDDIAERSGVMLEKLRVIQEEERNKEQEENRDEQLRRRGRTSR